ncbi:MAG: hypothetical protein GF317_23400 [Candidatus Lokiarchaeota archaeon]|nr:hypothetical protein [Candidatus Lokiarchaeota archaeon]
MAVEILIPGINPIRFTQVETIDYEDIFPNIDNRLFVDNDWIDVDNMRYRDKYLKEEYRIQLYANFGSIYVIGDYFSGKIYDTNGVQVLDFTSTHDALLVDGVPIDLFHAFDINFSGLDSGCYYGVIEIYSGDGSTVEATFRTNIFEVKDSLADYLRIEAFHSENDFGWIFTDDSVTPVESTSKFYLKGSMMDYQPGQVKSTYKDDLAELFVLDSRPERIWSCKFFAVPDYVLDRLNLIFSCNSIKINDIEYLNEDGLNVERLGTGNLFDVTIQLSQKNWDYYQNIPTSDLARPFDLEDGGFDDDLEDHTVIKDGGNDDSLQSFEWIDDGN